MLKHISPFLRRTRASGRSMRKEKVKFDLSSSPLLRLALYSLILPPLRILTSYLIARAQMWITGIQFRLLTKLIYCFPRVAVARNIGEWTIDLKTKINNWQRKWSHAENWRALLKWNVRPHSRVFKDNEISRGFKIIRFLSFLYGRSLRNFSHARLMKVDLFII